jgi:hypothetical protein
MVMLMGALSVAWGQDSYVPSSISDAQEQNPQQSVAPDSGQENRPAPIMENPPVSSLDVPALVPHGGARNYLQAAVTATESLDTNVANSLGPGDIGSVSRVLGNLTLHRLWSRYDLALDYVGGVGYYATKGQGLRDMQQMDFEQKTLWKRGQLSLRDSFSYLPEGNFGDAYGSLGSEGVESLGGTPFAGFWGGAALGSLGLSPRILNVSLAEGQYYLSPKSAVTGIGGYAFTHFFDNGQAGTSFISSSQVSGQAAYDRVLTPHTQVGLVYGYQGFDFSVVGTAFHADVIEGMYGHRVSGRMDLLLGAGPEVTFIDTQSAVCSNPIVPPVFCTLLGGTIKSTTVENTQVSVAAQARLRYQLPKTSLDLSFERFESSGSGLFTGAQTNIVHLYAFRPLSRVWTAFTDIGFAYNTRIQPLTPVQVSACSGTTSSPSACPANDATSYMYGFVGGGVHRSFGRNFHAFFNYQFNELAFNSSFCIGKGACDRISNRQVATFGLDWTPRPIRID